MCSVPNTPAFANVSNCCGSAPVQYTPDYCRIFCAYDFSKETEWFQCVGYDLEASCQNGKDSSPTPSGSQTNPTTTNLRSSSQTARAAPAVTWSKSALLLGVLCFVGLAAGQQIQSCKDGQCEQCDVGNSPDPLGPNEWGIQGGYPHCIVYSGASFQGAELEAGGGCKHNMILIYAYSLMIRR